MMGDVGMVRWEDVRMVIKGMNRWYDGRCRYGNMGAVRMVR